MSSPAGASHPFGPIEAKPTLAEITEANRVRATTEARERDAAPARARIWRYLTRGATAGVVVALAAGGVLVASQDAEARVLHTPPVTAQQGPATVADGRVICKGSYHVTVPVRTTKVAADGRHYAAVWLQQHRTGRAKLVGWARSFDSTVNVVGCVDPALVDGRHGPVYVIAEDALDGRTRPVRVRFDGHRYHVVGGR